MELRHLRYFEAVARERSFTRAARLLHVAQPALSRQIRALEEELGTALFEREQRPVRLTEAGRLCYQATTQILAGVQQMRQAVQQLRIAGPARFVVGVVGSIMHGGLPETLRRFREQSHGVELDLVEMTTLEQVGALKDGRIDAGLGRVRIDDAAIRREILLHEPLVAALPVAMALTDPDPGADADRTPRVTLEVLARYPLIAYPLMPRPSYADQVLGLFRDHGLAPAKVIEVREIQTALGLVSAEAGIAIVPQSMQQLHRGEIRYVPLADRQARSPVILSQRDNDASAAGDLFRTIARHVFSGEAKATPTTD
ncbi:LysR family transcriptional regulator [Novosphingobium colocasiae]|uniref:LysR family transcriptional regulator n=1 Tax=Novosphingobium colocasiae TaxID=1256513 RepID=A0A918PGC9_9SPHN|nr:LysR family transcriptional regulator [Novosphingobium colocasiae]GGZ05491.1 LysR family transcriptional regulator [Novosphingobium colocasiae]